MKCHKRIGEALKCAPMMIVASCLGLTLLASPAFADDVAAGTSASQGDSSAMGVSTTWSQYGQCEWAIDQGCLVIRPANGASSAALDYYYMSAPWSNYEDEILSVRFEGVVKVEKPAYMFAHLRNAESIDLTGLDTSSAVNMDRMFLACESLKSLDLSGVDSSCVTSMQGMFSDCSALESVNLAGLDTSNVSDMAVMFARCSSLKSIDVSGFNTSQVLNMNVMFEDCSSLETLDLSAFDTSKASVSGMFAGCESLRSVDVSSFDTSNVSNLVSMFEGCSSLESLDLSNFDTSKATQMQSMFEGCDSLAVVTLGSSFSFSGANSERLCSLPASGQDGTVAYEWRDINSGKQYAAEDVPNNVSAVYERQMVEITGKWVESNGRWWWNYGDGSYPVSTWEIIDGEYYYFDANGWMQTGWLSSGGSWYYLSGSGVMQTGWQSVGGAWYWFDGSGAMATGWREVGGSWYCFGGSGAMQTSRWVGDCYVLASGKMATNQVADGYYVDESGCWQYVYWIANGDVYHKTPNCTSLKRSSNIMSGSVAASGKSSQCRVCWK